MLRPTSALVVVAPLLWAMVLGQVTLGPSVYILPAASALNASTPRPTMLSTLASLDTPTSAPTFSVVPLTESPSQSIGTSDQLSGSTVTPSTSSAVTSAISITPWTSAVAITSVIAVTVEVQEPAPSTTTILASGTTVTVFASSTLSLNNTASGSTAFYLNFTTTSSSTVPSLPSQTLSTVTASVGFTEQQSISITTTSVLASGSSIASASPSLLVSEFVTNTPSLSSSTIDSSQTSPVIVSTVNLFLNTLAGTTLGLTMSSFPQGSETSGVALGGPVAASNSLAITSMPAPVASAMGTSPFRSSSLFLSLASPILSQCTATVWMTETVTVFQTVTETCPTTGSTTTSLLTSALATAASMQSILPPSSGSEINGTCSASDNSTQCQPGISKVFGPIVVDVLVEGRPSTFSTVTVYTTSGFITQLPGSNGGVIASAPLPSSCSRSSSGSIVCNGCPSSLFGVTCAWICTIVGSPTPASFCEPNDKTGSVASDEGVMQCVPCSGVSSTLTFAPTEPIVQGVTGAPAATVSFTEIPTISGAGGGQGGLVTQPDVLSSAVPISGSLIGSIAPETYEISVGTSPVPASNVDSSTKSSFTLVALTSPAAPTPVPVAVITSGSTITSLLPASETMPVSTVVTSLPQLSTGINTATALVAAASSVPNSPQAATTAVAGVGAGISSCTSVSPNAKPSPAYTDQQNGLLYRIQCGTTLDLVLQCPYLCSEGGGGLFRQCENSDQSGASSTAGDVGIVCQQCLPPCGSSTKRSLLHGDQEVDDIENHTIEDDVPGLLEPESTASKPLFSFGDESKFGRELIRKDVNDAAPKPHSVLPLSMLSTRPSQPSQPTNTAGRQSPFGTMSVSMNALIPTQTEKVVRPTGRPSHCMPRMGCIPTMDALPFSKPPWILDTTYDQSSANVQVDHVNEDIAISTRARP